MNEFRFLATLLTILDIARIVSFAIARVLDGWTASQTSRTYQVQLFPHSLAAQRLAMLPTESSFRNVATVTGMDLLGRLRSETRADHDAIEHALALMDAQLTPDGYRNRVERFYGFYRPLEEKMVERSAWFAPWLNIRERLKTPLLLADLDALHCPPPASLPLCSSLPRLDGPSECFGCLYVLEGSTLGGQLIGRHLREKLNVTPVTGGLFFNGYGSRTGAMWQQFRQALTEFADNAGVSLDHADTHDRVVASARLTFQTLRRWCETARGI